MPDLPIGIVKRLMNLFATPTLWLQDNWGGLVGLKMQSNIIVHHRTMFYMRN